MAAVEHDDVAQRHRLARRRARGRARRSRAPGSAPPARGRCRWRSPARARRRGPSSAARSSACAGSCDVEGATSTTGPRPAAARRARPAAPTAAARRPAATAPSAAGTRAGGACRPASARARARCGRHGSGPSPRRRAASRCTRARPCSSAAHDEAPVGPRQSAAPERACAAGARRSSTTGCPGGDERVHVRDERRQRHALELGGERRRGGEDVGDGDVGREVVHERADLAAPRAPPPRRASAASRASGRPGTRAPA